MLKLKEEGETAFPVEGDYPTWWTMPLLQAASAEGGTRHLRSCLSDSEQAKGEMVSDPEAGF